MASITFDMHASPTGLHKEARTPKKLSRQVCKGGAIHAAMPLDPLHAQRNYRKESNRMNHRVAPAFDPNLRWSEAACALSYPSSLPNREGVLGIQARKGTNPSYHRRMQPPESLDAA